MRFVSKRIVIHETAYDVDELFAMKGKLQRVLLAATCADVETLQMLFARFCERADGRGASFTVFLDRSGNRALLHQEQHSEYCCLHDQIQSFCRGSGGIRLVNPDGSGALFHAKMMLLHSTLASKVIVGSMNFTRGGINPDSNEELLLQVSKPAKRLLKAAETYFSCLTQAHSVAVDENEWRVHRPSLREFFLAGRLYAPLDTLNMFTFQLQLPEELGQSPADLHELLARGVRGSINVLNLCAPRPEGAGGADDAPAVVDEGWKRYCMETPYGYWAPAEYIPALNDMLEQGSADSTVGLSARLRYIGTRGFLDAAEAFFAELSQRLEQHYSLDWSVDRQRWEDWHATLCSRLYADADSLNIRDTVLRRLVSGVQEAALPDLWDDVVLAGHFENSFLEALQFQAAKTVVDNALAQVLGYPDTLADLHERVGDAGEQGLWPGIV